MLNIFLVAFGCVRIEISGDGIERLLNSAAKYRIPIRDLRYANRTVTGNIAPRDLLRLRAARRGTGAGIHILKKSGLLFKIKPHLGRTGFMAGFVVFLAVLKLISLFVWSVEVNGNKTVEAEKILRVCEDLGIKNGVMQSSIDPKLLAERLILRIPRLTWASVNIEGCRITVNVSEAERTEEYRKKPPSNLIASKDGRIVKIDTVSGETLVSVGDYVAKGDILVSGIIESGGSRTFLNSAGEIYAEAETVFTENENFKSHTFRRTGKKKRKVLSLFWLEIPLYLGRVNAPYTVRVTEKEFSVSGAKMPAKLTEAEFTLLEKRKVTYSRDTLERILKNRLDSAVAKKIKGEFEIVSQVFSADEKGMTATMTVKQVENIAKECEISLVP